MPKPEDGGQGRGVDFPGEVGRPHAAVVHWTGQPKCRAGGGWVKLFDKRLKDGFQAGELLARVASVGEESGAPLVHLEQPKTCVSATDVPSDNHVSPFSQ